ncbi:MAG: 50S ribosomal protein L22 [Acidimicrobiales bacterium]
MAVSPVGTKTNERPGTRAQMRFARFSASKARAVLDLVRGLPVNEAAEVLQFTERGPSVLISKVLASAIANAEHNDELDGDSLYVAACYADEGPTLKRWRPRARGRATRIRKRTCHITIIVAPMPDEMAAQVEARQAAGTAAPAGRRRGRRAQESRRARVARSRGETVAVETEEQAQDTATESPETDVTPDERGLENAEGAEGVPEADDDEEAEEAGDTAEEVASGEADEAESPEEDEMTDERGFEGAAASPEADDDEDSPEESK